MERGRGRGTASGTATRASGVGETAGEPVSLSSKSTYPEVPRSARWDVDFERAGETISNSHTCRGFFASQPNTFHRHRFRRRTGGYVGFMGERGMTIRTPQDQDEVDVRCRCEVIWSILLKSTLTPPSSFVLSSSHHRESCAQIFITSRLLSHHSDAQYPTHNAHLRSNIR